VTHENNVAHIQFANNAEDIVGISLQRLVPLRVPGRGVRCTAADVVEQNQPEARRESIFNQSPQMLIAPEAVSQHDRRTILDSGEPHVVPRLAVHAFILPPVCISTVVTVRWIVDAMNVIGSRPDGWWKDREGARARLVEQLDRWVSAHAHAVTVVFEHPTSIRSSAIAIRHAPQAASNSADDEIVRLVGADDRPDEIVVVTSDAKLAERIRSAGAAVYPAAKFRNLIDPLNAT
jgi:predicted RNA-binding protein with PIN domain